MRALRHRGRLAVVLAIVLALVAAWWVTRDAEGYDGELDPRNPGPEGGQAIAKVLADQGVEVDIVRSAAALEDSRVDESTTVVVTSTSALSPSTLDRLREHATTGRLVLVDPTYPVVQKIDADLGRLPDLDATAQCTGSVDGIDFDGQQIEVDSAVAFDGRGCFPTSSGSLLVADETTGIVLFGAGEALSNDQALRADNAAVALRLLGAGDHLVWYVPDPTDASADEAVSLTSLLPDWVGPGLWLAAIAALGLIGWRFRRLGPLATEPLPVVVRAVETARSRGRMYRRTSDRAHAARNLRRAARRDLASQLRLDRRAEPAAVVDATARHLGVRADELRHLLTDDQPPASDHDLVALAQGLARLRREVRRA